MTKRLLVLAALTSAAVISATPAEAQQQYTYTATLQATTRVSGAVNASNIAWQCSGTTCTTSGPWPQPGVAACVALARQVGRVTAYGRPGAMLNATQLAQCNQGLAAPLNVPPNVILRPTPQIIVRPQQQPQQQQPPQQQPPQQQPPQQQPPQQQPPQQPPPPRAADGPIRTETLTVTGTGALRPAPPFTPSTVRTETLTVTGTGALRPPPPFTPRTTRIEQPLTVTGTGSLTPTP